MSDPIIEAAARALQIADVRLTRANAARLAPSVLTAVTPLIRNAALEEAAKVAEEVSSGQTMTRKKIAFRIRALKPASPSPSADSA